MSTKARSKKAPKSARTTRWWVPVTPGGSVLAHLEGRTEMDAWKLLIGDMGPHAENAGYLRSTLESTIAAMKRRGYEVIKL